MAPEITFWNHLVKEGALCLKQKIPDVAIIENGRVQAWYHSTSRGLLMEKQGPHSVDALLERLLTAAKRRTREEVQATTPVAILRRLAPGRIDSPAGLPTDAPADVFVAIVLNAGELTSLVARLRNGLDDSEAFSLQAIVEPSEDLRIVSVYSCDSLGEETSDIFGRKFGSMYPIHVDTVVIPTKEEVALDRCTALPPAQYNSVEAKTLSLVRYVSRFHSRQLSGLICEFIIDREGQLVLHAFWSVSVFPKGSTYVTPDTVAKPSGQPVPVPLPVVGSGPPSEAPFERGEEDAPPSFQAPPPEAFYAGIRSPPFGSPEDQFGRPRTPEAAVAEAALPHAPERPTAMMVPADVLLEVWSGEVCLGATWLPPVTNGPASLTLPLGELADGRPEAERVMQDPIPPASVINLFVDFSYELGEDRGCLQLELRGAHGLACPPSERALRPQVRLFLRKPPALCPPDAPATFVPLYVSREVLNASNPDWGENVELWIPCFLPEPRPPSAPRPDSARRFEAREEASPKSGFTGGFAPRGSPPGSRPATPPLRGSGGGAGAGAGRPTSASLAGATVGVPRGRSNSATSVRRPSVAGASVDAHWGMTTAGTLSSHVLAKQVLSRFSTEKQMRSTMLAALARQVERYRDLHLAWQEQRAAARDVVAKAEKEVLYRDRELVAEKKRSEHEIEKYRARLGAVYRGLQKELDELREQKHGLENQFQESLQREREQTSMIESLESRNKALRLTLDKTVQKLNDVQSQRADAERGRAALQSAAGRVEQAPELQSALQQIEVLAASRDRAEEEAGAARTGMLRLQNEVQRERALAAYYEDFVRKVASGPEACVRTGGGYLVDSRAKAEAAALLRESAAFARQAALYPSDGSYPPTAEFASIEQGADLGA